MPALERLGAEIRRVRQAAGLSQRTLAAIAGRDASFLSRVERGSRRVRLDTLRVIAVGLAEAGAGDPEEMLARFVALAGASLASPSQWPGWAEKIERRRQKRRRRRARRSGRAS